MKKMKNNFTYLWSEIQQDRAAKITEDAQKLIRISQQEHFDVNEKELTVIQTPYTIKL
jgi:hypothetical protein